MPKETTDELPYEFDLWGTSVPENFLIFLHHMGNIGFTVRVTQEVDYLAVILGAKLTLGDKNTRTHDAYEKITVPLEKFTPSADATFAIQHSFDVDPDSRYALSVTMPAKRLFADIEKVREEMSARWLKAIEDRAS